MLQPPGEGGVSSPFVVLANQAEIRIQWHVPELTKGGGRTI